MNLLKSFMTTVKMRYKQTGNVTVWFEKHRSHEHIKTKEVTHSKVSASFRMQWVSN